MIVKIRNILNVSEQMVLIIYSVFFPDVFAIHKVTVTARMELVLATYCKMEWGKELLGFLSKFLPLLKKRKA